jgi:hypothetical protein
LAVQKNRLYIQHRSQLTKKLATCELLHRFAGPEIQTTDQPVHGPGKDQRLQGMDEQLGHALPHLTGKGVATIVSTGLISDVEIHRLNFGDLNIAGLNISGMCLRN